jgi:hypothetical protein
VPDRPSTPPNGPRDAPGDRYDPPPMADDGLPTLPTGEPVLARWFVIAMLVLAPLAVIVTVWAVLSIPEGDIDPAERRPPGTDEVTYDRGDAVLGRIQDGEAGPGCGQNVTLVGDEGAHAAARVAVRALCEALRTPGLDEARDGLRAWSGGRLRFAVFERSGVESSTRVEDGDLVVELNAKFQFEDAARAAPVLVHELTLLGDGEFPGLPVGATAALRATEAQHLVCEETGLLDEDDPPRGCLDAAELLELPEPLDELIAAGLRDDR